MPIIICGTEAPFGGTALWIFAVKVPLSLLPTSIITYNDCFVNIYAPINIRVGPEAPFAFITIYKNLLQQSFCTTARGLFIR